MKRYILSSEYVKYNANARGNNSEDCVKRSLSLAFDMDYNEVSKELLAISKKKGVEWNMDVVFEEFVRNPGRTDRIIPTDNTKTVGEMIDEIGQSGVIIYETSKRPAKPMLGHHLTCSIDGKLFDSWDCRNEYVTQYYIIEGRNALTMSDISSNFNALSEYAGDAIAAEFDKHINKLNYTDIVDYTIDSGFTSNGEYSFKKSATVKISLPNNRTKTFMYKFAYVFTPSTSREEAKKKIIEVTKIRVYDRFYSLKKIIAEDLEAAKLYEEAGYAPSQAKLRLDNREARFFDSLPGWIKPFITELSIEAPGQYHDSYRLVFNPLSGDSNKDPVFLYGYDSNMMKQEISIYKSEFRRPGIDYDANLL